MAAQRRCAAGVGLSVLGGHPPSVLLVGVFMVAPLAILFAVREPGAGMRAPRQIAGRLALLALATLVGLLAGAVMLLPFGEAVAQSSGNADRGGVGLPHRALNTLIFPEIWGNPLKFELAGAPTNYQERVLYFGVIPLLLAIASFVARRPSATQWVLGSVGAVAAAVLFVRPLGQALLAVPGFSSSTIRPHVVIAFAGVALAAYGVDTLVTGTRAERKRLAVAVAIVGLLVPLQWLVRHDEVYGRLGDAFRHFPALDGEVPDGDAVRFGEVLGFAIYALVAAAVAAIAIRGRWAVGLVGVLLAAVVLDATMVGRYIPIVDRDRVDVATGPTLRFFQERAAAGERVAGDVNLYGPDLSNRWATNDPRAHASPPPQRYEDLWLRLGGTGVGDNEQRTQFGRSREVPGLLDLFSVRWVLSFDLETNTPRKFRRTTEPLEWPVFENRGHHPRARFVSTWDAAANGEEALERVAGEDARVVGDRPVIEGVRASSAGGVRRAVPARLVATRTPLRGSRSTRRATATSSSTISTTRAGAPRSTGATPRSARRTSRSVRCRCREAGMW